MRRPSLGSMRWSSHAVGGRHAPLPSSRAPHRIRILRERAAAGMGDGGRWRGSEGEGEGRWRQGGRERRGEERGGGGEGSEGAAGWLFCKSVSWGSVCKNNSNIEFFLLHVELNFNRRTYVKNIRTWFLFILGALY